VNCISLLRKNVHVTHVTGHIASVSVNLFSDVDITIFSVFLLLFLILFRFEFFSNNSQTFL